MLTSPLSIVDTTNGTFQIRPSKDFVASKGRDRLLLLRLLSELPVEDPIAGASSELGSSGEPRNAYDFMRRRRELNGDPVTERWNAAIRLCNYASLETAPMCVSICAHIVSHLREADILVPV